MKWLDKQGIPYWDLCFMRDKHSVDVDIYLEDAPDNIEFLRAADKSGIVFDNSTNRSVPDDPGGRAQNWSEAEQMIREHYYAFLDTEGCAHPAEPGRRPPWDKTISV